MITNTIPLLYASHLVSQSNYEDLPAWFQLIMIVIWSVFIFVMIFLIVYEYIRDK